MCSVFCFERNQVRDWTEASVLALSSQITR